MMLTLWRCQRPSLYGRPAGVEPAFCRFWRLAGSSLGKRKPPRGFPLGRLPASASWRLHGNHSAGQGSLKLRDWIHVPGSFWQLQCRHTSMVSRLPAQGNCIYRRVVDPGSGRHRDAAARTPHPRPAARCRRPPARRRRPPPTARRRYPPPGAGKGRGCGSLHPRVCTLPQPHHAAGSRAPADLSPGAGSERCNGPLPGKDRTIQYATGTGIP